MKGSPSSSEGALTSLRPDLPLRPPNLGGLTIDKFMSQLGNPGRYQILLMLLLASNCIPVVVNHLIMTFYAAKTPHHCKLPPNETEKAVWLPLEDLGFNSNHSHSKYMSCEMFVDPANISLGTQSCIYGYEYETREGEWNVVTEWDLVCDRGYLAPLTTTTYFCGVCIGGIIFGALADRFGRKSMMLICLYTQCIIGLVIHFATSLVVFMSLRFMQGIFIQGLQCVTYSMVMELFGPTYRTMAGCIIEAFWALGLMIIAVMTMYIQNWRYIQLAINVPTLSTIIFIWIIPESLRWLISKGKYNRASVVVKTVIKCNKLQIDPAWLKEEMEELGQVLAMQDVHHKQPDIRDMVTNKGIRKYSLALFFIWFSVSLTYYGISFSIPNLSGDRHLNFMIEGGIELGAFLLAFVVLNGFGRKYSLMVYLFLSGIISMTCVSVQQFVPDDFVDTTALSTGLALVGKASVVSCFCCIFIYSCEIFPTVIRTVGIGTCAFFGRIGSLLASQVLWLGTFVYPTAPRFVTFFVFGIFSILAGFLTLVLPETLNKELPDTVTQAEHLGEEKEDDLNYSHTLGSGLGDDEVGYGKSPEWVEVDGHIVSKGVASLVRDRGNERRSGSILSLPYSSRTQLTYNSSSSGQSGSGKLGHSLGGSGRREDSYKIDTDENDYETIPADVSNISQASIRNDDDKYSLDRPDTSVISAQSGLYEILPKTSRSGLTTPRGSSDCIDSSNGLFYLRKNLLMSDANETRL